jgi:regulator of sigma E protease
VLLTIASFVFVLGVLIFVHELGHFIAAKAVGIGVPRFSIGFGAPTPLRFRRGETEYVVSWFPLGGYVKMASREEQDAMSGLEGGPTADGFPRERLFESKPLWARIVVISAGVAMNFIFALLVYAGLAAVLGRTEDPTTAIAHVDAGGLPTEALALAGVPSGARIVRVNGDSVESWDGIMSGVLNPASDRLRFDFAGGLDPVIIPVKGTEATARARILNAMTPLWPARIGTTAPGQPAAAAGLRRGDRLLSADGTPLETFYDIMAAVEPSIGDTLTLQVQRDDSLFAVAVVPTGQRLKDPVTDQERTVGRIGINPWIEPIHVRFGPIAAVAEGARHTWTDVVLVAVTVKGIAFREVSPKEIGGPILIGQLSGQVARFGPAALLAFMALLSVNLAVLNLLPIPVLDGGHLVFLLIEGVRGRPLSLTARLRLTQAGLVLLLGLMALVFTNDILRLVGG